MRKHVFQRLREAWLTAVILVAFGLPATNALARHQVRLPSGEIVEGTAIRLDDDGNYVLTTPRGDLTFPPDTPVAVAEPREFTRAQQLLQQGRNEEALRLLQVVVENYRGLQWDRRALPLLADAYFASGNLDRAAEIYENVASEMPEAFDDDDRVAKYLEALVRAGDEAALRRALHNTIRNRSRGSAARAQMMRGNLNFERGETEQALLDFLRTAVFFRDIPEFHAEALAKTVQIMRQSGHDDAETFARQLAELYPDR